jgi:hypothetical protein
VAQLGDDPQEVVTLIARSDDNGLLRQLEERHGTSLAHRCADCRAEARRQLTADRGNPAPYPLL